MSEQAQARRVAACLLWVCQAHNHLHQWDHRQETTETELLRVSFGCIALPASYYQVTLADSPMPAEPRVDARQWLVLALVLCGTFMAVFDVFVVNVAVPTIQRELQASVAQVQFVIAGYTLTYAIALITGGRLGDIYGRKRLFMLAWPASSSPPLFAALPRRRGSSSRRGSRRGWRQRC